MVGHGGVSIQQDPKYAHKLSNKKPVQVPDELLNKVDMQKVHLDSIKPWIHRRTCELLDGVEDEILADFVASMLESSRYPDAKDFLNNLAGFLENNTELFVTELWQLLCDGQQSLGGIPTAFVQEKKDELLRKKYEDGKRRLMDRKLSSADSSQVSSKSSEPAVADKKMSEMERIIKEEEERRPHRSSDRSRRSRSPDRGNRHSNDDDRDFRARMDRSNRRTYYERSPERLRTQQPARHECSRDKDIIYDKRERSRSRDRYGRISRGRDRSSRREYSRSPSPYRSSRRSRDIYDNVERRRSRSRSRSRYDSRRRSWSRRSRDGSRSRRYYSRSRSDSRRRRR